MSIIIQTNLFQDDYSYSYYSYTPEDENIKEKPRAASTPPPQIHPEAVVQPKIVVSKPVLTPANQLVLEKKWAARPAPERIAASSSSSKLPARVPPAVAVASSTSSKLPARVPAAVADEPKQSEPGIVWEYNDRDDVGTLAVANYS